MPFAAPAAIFASASLSQASYSAPPEGSQPRRSSVPEVELSTSALTFAGMGDGVVQHRPAAHRLGDEAHLGEFQVIDQRGEIARVVARIRPAGNRVRRREAAMGEGTQV